MYRMISSSRHVQSVLKTLLVLLAVSLISCGGGGSRGPGDAGIIVSVSGASTLLNTGAARTFTAKVSGTSNPMPYNCTNPGASSYLYAAVAGGGGPVWVAVDLAGAFVYLGMQPSPIAGTQGVSVLRIDGTSGALTAVAGSPFATDQFYTAWRSQNHKPCECMKGQTI
ncbi:MAG: hypothetical protein JWN74_62 [Acidobacteriaceae bacterium]|nr:hypothetical protein [Acidobacteriaceae bacterium]